MITRRSLATTAFALVLLGTLTGCTMQQQLPTWQDAQTETQDAIQRVLDELPTDTHLNDRSDDVPYACGDGAMFTGHWEADLPQGFDVAAFIDGLPAALGTDFTPEASDVPLSDPNVNLRAKTYGNIVVSVRGYEFEGHPALDVLAISRCAQRPAQ
jgi:hypothetical protein